MTESSSSISNMAHVVIDDDAHPMLKSDMAKMFKDILSIIQKQIGKSAVSISSIRISLKNDPEEDRDELIFRVNVKNDAEEALAFWDSIGKTISDWRPTLSKRRQHLLDEKIGIFVEW